MILATRVRAPLERARHTDLLALVLLASAGIAQAQEDGAAAGPDTAGENAEVAPYDKTVPVAGAEASAEPAPAAESESRVIGLEDVTITSTKRERVLRDVPQSIDAFSGEQLQSVGANDLQSVVRFTPGVTVSPGMTGESAAVIFRGVSTDTMASFTTRTFGLLYDDVSLINPTVPGPQPNLDPFDMRAVEVLKGPQGTLFGGSALAGAVRYSPNRADYEQFAATVFGGAGELERSDDQSSHISGMVNLPLGDSLALRVVATRRDEAGFIDDTRGDRDDINSSTSEQYRVLLGWRPADDLEFRLSGLHREYQLDDGTFADNTETPDNSSRFFPEFVDSETSLATLTMEWGFEPASLVLTGSYLEKKFEQVLDASTFAGTNLVGVGTYVSLPGESEQPSGEIRLVSNRPLESSFAPLDRWEYVVGYAYTRSDQLSSVDLGVQFVGDALVQGVDALAEEHALFFDLTRQLGESFEIGLGGRLFRHTTDASSRSAFVAPNSVVSGIPLLAPLAALVPEIPIPNGTIEGSLEEEEFNPKVTLQWRVAQDLALFTSATKGYRFGGINTNPLGNPQIPDFFKSDTIWNYELGARSRWLDGLLQIDLTLFYLEWDDVQLQQPILFGALSYTDNVGGAESRGAELAVQAVLPYGFTMKLSGAYVEAETTEFFRDARGPVEEGTELPGTSPFSGSAQLEYANLFGSVLTRASVSYTYQTENFNNLTQTFEHPDLGLLGATLSARLESLPGNPELSLIGKNLTDELEPVLLTDAFLTGGELVVFNQPRTLSLNLRLDF